MRETEKGKLELILYLAPAAGGRTFFLWSVLKTILTELSPGHRGQQNIIALEILFPLR